jgi:hypothetical protein
MFTILPPTASNRRIAAGLKRSEVPIVDHAVVAGWIPRPRDGDHLGGDVQTHRGEPVLLKEPGRAPGAASKVDGSLPEDVVAE